MALFYFCVAFVSIKNRKTKKWSDSTFFSLHVFPRKPDHPVPGHPKILQASFFVMQYFFHKPGQNEPGHQARQMKAAFVGAFAA